MTTGTKPSMQEQQTTTATRRRRRSRRRRRRRRRSQYQGEIQAQKRCCEIIIRVQQLAFLCLSSQLYNINAFLNRSDNKKIGFESQYTYIYSSDRACFDVNSIYTHIPEWQCVIICSFDIE